VTVVAAVELHEQVAPGRAARDPDGAHRRLGARADQPHHLHRRIGGADDLGHLDLERGGCAVAGAPARRLGHRLHDGRGRVAQDQRAPGADEVDVGPPVRVPEPRPLAARDEERSAADGAEGAHGAVDAARDHPARGVEQTPGLTHAGNSIWTKSRRPASQRNAATEVTT
jgi:hypothetical protein